MDKDPTNLMWQPTVRRLAVFPDQGDVGGDDGVRAVADELEALLAPGCVLDESMINNKA
jgi:hypothetical protein